MGTCVKHMYACVFTCALASMRSSLHLLGCCFRFSFKCLSGISAFFTLAVVDVACKGSCSKLYFERICLNYSRTRTLLFFESTYAELKQICVQVKCLRHKCKLYKQTTNKQSNKGSKLRTKQFQACQSIAYIAEVAVWDLF